MLDGLKFNPADPCPHPPIYTIEGQDLTAAQVVEMLSPHLMPERLEKLQKAVAGRTYHFTPVLENIYDQGNINAVVRSAESFGLQSYHVISSGQTKPPQNRIARGAEKWVDGWEWKNSESCFRALKMAGYKIATTHLSEQALPIAELPVDEKWALVLGNEKDGVSPVALGFSDANVLIPTVGLTQSFNLSVAGAICFYQAFQMRVTRLGSMGDLGRNWHERLMADFIFRSLDSAPQILAAKLRS